MSTVVLAHGGVGGQASLWSTVTALLALCALGAMYGKGVQELWARRGRGAVISVRRVVAFGVGLSMVALAISRPVEELAEASFTGHMVQHMVLMVVAAPLLGLGGVALALTMALPHRFRRGVARFRAGAPLRWLRRPVNRAIIGGLAFTAVLWCWHMPGIYVLALESDAVHGLEHVGFLVVAWALWSAVLTPDAHRLNGPVAFLTLFAVGMTGAALGAVLTFAPAPLYAPEAFGGTDPLADQQLAGLVMWIPMDVVVMGVALWTFGQWLRDLSRRYPGERPMVGDEIRAEVMVP